MSLYLMADPHFDDEYMLNYAGRGIFDSVESMNNAILKNSMCLNDDDTIIYVGDFCSRDSCYLGVYRNILNKIRGK
jgi:calcineurin-like phosphoesterase family protein